MITLTVGFDGVVYLKNKSMWPLVAYINELNFTERQANFLLLSLFAGSSPPQGMLHPLIEELKMYNKRPLEIVVNGEKINFYVRCLLFIADAPARATIMNHSRFNGRFGCTWCRVKTKYKRISKSRIYRLESNHQIKDRASWKRWAKSREYGVKGQCEVLKLKYVQPFCICPPEYLHSQLLGTTKLLIDAWVKGKKKQKPCLKKRDIELINRRLLDIKFPAKALRTLPNIGEKWKAADYENMLFYGLISLEGVLEKRKLDNFKLLSFIISELSKKEVIETRLGIVSDKIQEFFTSFQSIYNPSLNRYNVHSLSHLVSTVQMYGPLLTNSGFIVENTMGVLARKTHSWSSVALQVMNKCITRSSIMAKLHKEQSPTLLNSIQEVFPNFLPKSLTVDSSGPPVVTLSDQGSHLSKKQVNVLGSPNDFEFFRRCQTNKVTITTTAQNDFRSANYAVKFGEYFYLIEKIAKNISTGRVFAIARRFERISSWDPLEHVHNCRRTSTLDKICVEAIVEMCVYSNVNNTVRFAEIFNRHL